MDYYYSKIGIEIFTNSKFIEINIFLDTIVYWIVKKKKKKKKKKRKISEQKY